MLRVHTMIGHTEGDVKNGTSQRRYHGNTTGAKIRDAAIGQAKALATLRLEILWLSHAAVNNPTSTAIAASNRGCATVWNKAKTGPLKRKPVTYVPSEPIGMRP